MNTTDKKNILLGSAIGVIPVIWAALIAAPYMRNGLLEHMDELSGAFRQPFQIRITENTLRTILFFLVIYAVSIGIWFHRHLVLHPEELPPWRRTRLCEMGRP